jgi:hypothetical protein
VIHAQPWIPLVLVLATLPSLPATVQGQDKKHTKLGDIPQEKGLMAADDFVQCTYASWKGAFMLTGENGRAMYTTDKSVTIVDLEFYADNDYNWFFKEKGNAIYWAFGKEPWDANKFTIRKSTDLKVFTDFDMSAVRANK